jgi:hypothetical protein
MGSASSKKFLESQSQPDDTGHSTADVLVEPPNDTHCWPVSASASTGALGSLENRSGNNLEGLDSPSETQNVIRTWSENSPWGLPIEVGNAASLTSARPPTEMNSVPDSNVSLWPLFTTDADWQLDFDDQFTTLPTSAVKGATPIAVHNLDLSPSYNEPIQGSESLGLSRGMIEYLNLSEKVSANTTIPVKRIII